MSVPALADLQRAPSLAVQIYEQLRTQLRSGAFAAGERLVESTLAQSLSVSRSPVREALSHLAADGLLVRSGSGFQVVKPTAQDMIEIFEMRRLLEPSAARQVARTMTPALERDLSDALARARAGDKRGDFAAFTEGNYSFRAAWVGHVPSRRLRDTILRFDDQAGFVRRSTLVLPAARTEAIAIVTRYLDAFRARDEDAVAAITDDFIDAAERYYRDVAQDLS